MKGYDGYILLEYFIDQSMRPEKLYIMVQINVHDSGAKFTYQSD